MTTPIFDDSRSQDGPGPDDLPDPDGRLDGWGKAPARRPADGGDE